MTTTLVPGAAIEVDVMRICPLDVNGYLISGQSNYVTDTLVKVTPTLVVETGDDTVVKAASGDIGANFRHSDIPKYATIAIELAIPNPNLIAALCGGTVFNSTSTALGAPTGLTAAAQTTLGVLANGEYGYGISQGNSFGESPVSTEVDVAVTGPTGAVLLQGATIAAGATYMRFYGRSPGNLQLLGQLANIGTQTTNASSGTTPTSLTMVALTKPIPKGYTFTIAGDTNTPKIVFTTTAAAGVGALSIPVSISSTPITTIVAAALVPCFIDDGSVTSLGAKPIPAGGTDLSAGPGNNIGYQDSQLALVGNDSGVSIEMWSKRIIRGRWQTDYPYWWTVLPKVRGIHLTTSDYTNANQQTMAEGIADENPNWANGPDGTWPSDSTKWRQREVCGRQIVPVPTVVPYANLY
jgi:hypothetical protein